MRGGRVFRRHYRAPDGSRRQVATWTLRYYDRRRGRNVDEPTGLTNEREARALLRRRLVEIDDGVAPAPGAQRTTLANLLELGEADRRANGRRPNASRRAALRHLTDFFGERARAADVDEARIVEYQSSRLAEHAAPATVNRELAILGRAFRVGHKSRRVARVPAFQMLAEQNVRKGFFERGDFEALVAAMPRELQPLLRVYYCTGWRRSEVLSRDWRHIDFDAGWLRLEPGETKNRRGRQFPMIPELREALMAQRQYTDEVEATGVRVAAVFHRKGRRIKDFSRAWRRALGAVGLPVTARIHDFRRTAARNLLRASVPQSVAMALMGHETPSIFRRYAIVDEPLLASAGERLQALYQAENGMPRRVVAMNGGRGTPETSGGPTAPQN